MKHYQKILKPTGDFWIDGLKQRIVYLFGTDDECLYSLKKKLFYLILLMQYFVNVNDILKGIYFIAIIRIVFTFIQNHSHFKYQLILFLTIN